MYYVFLYSAVIGGTLFLAQFVLTMFGLIDTDLDVETEIADDVAAPPGDMDLDMEADVDHGVNAFVRMLSFRAVVASLTFFGLSGLASIQAGHHPIKAVVIGLIVGIAALGIVHFLMKTLYGLGEDGTVDIQNAVGCAASVYLPVPGRREGSGRVQVKMNNRVVEYEAVTSSGDALKTGDKVIVVDVLGPSLVEVEPDAETMID